MRKAWIAAFAALFAVTGAQALPPVEAFGSLPFLSDPQLSPDGRHFAAIQDLNGKPAVVLYPVNAAGQPQVFAPEEGFVIGVQWVKNDRAVMIAKRGTQFWAGGNIFTMYRAISLSVDGTESVQLFLQNGNANVNFSAAAVTDKNVTDPDTVLMPLWTATANRYVSTLYSVNVRDGHSWALERGSENTAQWITDGLGHIAGRVDRTEKPLTDHLFLYRDGSWKAARDFPGKADEELNVYGLTLDGASLAVLDSASGRAALATLDAKTGSDGTVLFSDPTYDIDDALTDEWTGRVVGVAYIADQMQYVYFDKSRQDLQIAIQKVFPGKDAHAVSLTQDGGTAIVAVQSATLPPTYYYLDRHTEIASKLASEYPGLGEADLGTMQPFSYKARDGVTIPGYLTIPPGRLAKNLPLVVMPHGGPDGRDWIRFDWWAQFLANRGYAVFQPNFRGSTGYGRAFNEAGHLQWGHRMQDDISDGVKALTAAGIADAARICIVGASYGGYAALAGATFTPELYRCAVSIAGPSDLNKMMGRPPRHDSSDRDLTFWETRIGRRGDPAVDAVSPALHADQVRVPVLLMHGKLDSTVDFEQSEFERDALERAGKNVRLVTFAGDDHYMTLAATRIQMLTELERFLKENIGQ